MKKNFKNRILIGLIILLVLITLLIVLSIIVLTCDDLDNESRDLAEIIINVALGITTLIGTISLGIVTVWQSQRANEISETVLKKELVTIFQIHQDAEFSIGKINNLEQVLEFSRLYPTEGAYCQSLPRNDSNFFKVKFYFKALSTPPSKIKILSFGFNSAFKKDQQRKKYYLPFSVLNHNKELCFVYNPSLELYTIEFYLFVDFIKLKFINKNGFFVMDFILEIFNVYGERQKIEYSVNFEQISNFNKIFEKKDSPSKKKITNVIFSEVRDYDKKEQQQSE